MLARTFVQNFDKKLRFRKDREHTHQIHALAKHRAVKTTRLRLPYPSKHKGHIHLVWHVMVTTTKVTLHPTWHVIDTVAKKAQQSAVC